MSHREDITTSYQEDVTVNYPQEITVVEGGKRLAIRYDSDMGDCFLSYNAKYGYGGQSEGPWQHWADMAVQILQHPLTQLVWPEAAEAVKHLTPLYLYSEVTRSLTEEELENYLRSEAT